MTPKAVKNQFFILEKNRFKKKAVEADEVNPARRSPAGFPWLLFTLSN